MGRLGWKIAIAALVVAATFLPQFVVQACGPDLSPPAFTHVSYPDVPLEAYAQGKLDLLQPGLRRVYLFVAYRNLIGKPLDRTESAAVRQILNGNSYWYIQQGADQEPPQPAATPLNWIDRWKTARKQVAGVSAQARLDDYNPAGIFRYDQGQGYYFSYLNCPSGAFQNAVEILDRRIARFGAQSPYVKKWLSAQDDVFTNCSGGLAYPPTPPVMAIPTPASSSDPLLIRQDRAYQIAAAHFYAGNFTAAQSEFAAIAKDSASPYHKLAPYLVARCLVREGTLTPGENAINRPPLEAAERQLEKILSDPNLAEYHHSARGLLDFVRIRLHPVQREKLLEVALDGAKPNPQFHQNLVDYLWLFHHAPAAHTQPNPPNTGGTANPVPAAVPGRMPGGMPSGMTDWIDTFAHPGSASFAHALALWQQTRSLPWLVAAISQAHASDSSAAQFVAAAQAVSPNFPAYVTVTFHRLRLLAEMGHAEQARRGLDRMLATRSISLSQGARNEFLALRMTLSRNLAEWLRYAPRRPVDMGGYGYATPAKMAQSSNQKFFDADSAVSLTERFPLAVLGEAARSAVLPANLRRQIAIALWTRAVLLGNTRIALRVVPLLASLAPRLKPSLASYAAAKSAPERNFAAVLLLLRFPGMRPYVSAGVDRWSIVKGPESLAHIDEFRDNWWCRLGASQNASANWGQFNYYTMDESLSSPLAEIYPSGAVPAPGFLTGRQRAVGQNEWAALGRIPTAPNWLGKQALDWAVAHPSDPRVPKALHFVVRATRYGCTDPQTSSYSKRAFLLLHHRYPGNSWTIKTPYWF